MTDNNIITRRGLLKRFAQACAIAVVGTAVPKQAEAVSPSAVNDGARALERILAKASLTDRDIR